jgi:hypothetical protein
MFWPEGSSYVLNSSLEWGSRSLDSIVHQICVIQLHVDPSRVQKNGIASEYSEQLQENVEMTGGGQIFLGFF